MFRMGTGGVGCQFIILLHRIQVQSAQGLGHYPVGPQRMGEDRRRIELVSKQVKGQRLVLNTQAIQERQSACY